MTLSLSPLTAVTAAREVEPAAPPPPPPLPNNEVVRASAAERTPEAATLEHLLATHPALATALPGKLESPRAKLLYLATQPALARQLAPLTVKIGEADGLRVARDGQLTLLESGAPTVRLNNRSGDLSRLLEGAQSWELANTVDLQTLLAASVDEYYRDPAFDGGGAAQSQRGGTAFTYANVVQVLVTADPSQRGLECLASASVHLWKSLGLVPPELSREAFEHRYTSIHGEVGGVRLGPEFNRTLRGGRSETRLDAAATAAFAQALKEDDWAKLTGASAGRYTVRALDSVDAVVAHFARGGAGVRSTWADGGHYFVLSGARVVNGEVLVNEDDSLNTQPKRRTAEGQQPYRTRYDPSSHTRFWTVERR